jgi:uncharacterized protein YbjQ (UPF0145 family)
MEEKTQIKYSGLSGNEMYCVALLGYSPGNIVIGNSVYAMGLIRQFGSGIRTIVGGEINQLTNIIAQGRQLSINRFNEELAKNNSNGACGITSELVMHPNNVEFLTIGSGLHRQDNINNYTFTSSSDGQELFCQWDIGYQPISFVFGNVAYSIGVTKGIIGSLRQVAKGEVKQYSDIFNTTRNLALERIVNEARSVNANSVIGIRTTILPVDLTAKIHEMIMIGTASYNQQLAETASSVGGVITSDLTAEETWNIAKLGYVPLKLVLSTSVYSLGLIGGVKASFKNLVKGEITELTNMIYGAREQAINKLLEQAQSINADDILGIKTYIYNLGSGLIEFLAIGTAVKKVDGLSSLTQQLPPQAIIRDKTTFVNVGNFSIARDLQNPEQ